ncbi:MAG TPA: PaaI family thioesterase [Gammaproteobacteria bacterium]|nr:PaaI family thioesterase [Gammaproteobacteria bacterium]
MSDGNAVQERVILLLQEKFSELNLKVQIPPPVFTAMQGSVIAFDEVNHTMQVRFPVTESSLNPFGNMQGGMIAAVIDNTLGPLSMLSAPPNFTRHLEIKYRKPVAGATPFLDVHCRLEGRNDRQLIFTASVIDANGAECASARAVHWILAAHS